MSLLDLYISGVVTSGSAIITSSGVTSGPPQRPEAERVREGPEELGRDRKGPLTELRQACPQQGRGENESREGSVLPSASLTRPLCGSRGQLIPSAQLMTSQSPRELSRRNSQLRAEGRVRSGGDGFPGRTSRILGHCGRR